MASRFATPWEENKKVALVVKGAAEVLGYSNTAKANRAHIDIEDKQSERIVLSGQNREVILINESGLYSLILRSDMPKVIDGGNNMIKAKDIMKIKSYTENQLLEIEYGLSNIELYLDQSKDVDLHKKVFIDRYIKNIPIEKLVDKYSISRTCLYGIVNRAKKAFEYNKEISIYKYK